MEKVLILKNELGLFEDPYRGVDPEREMRELRSPDKKRAAFHAATESAVLLENNGILPDHMQKVKIFWVRGRLTVS